MGNLGRAMNSFGIMMIVEFLLIGVYLIITGYLSGGPLTVISAFCTQSNITPDDLGIGIVVIGTAINIMIITPMVILLGGRR